MSRRSLIVAFASGMAFYSIPIVARGLASFLTIPVYTRYLTPTDYGILELLDLTSVLLSLLMGSNFAQALFYYHAEARSDAGRGQAISTAYFGSVLIGLATIVGSWLAAETVSQLVFKSTQYTLFLRLVFVQIGLQIPGEMGLCCIRVLDRSRTYALVSVIRLVVGIAVTIALLVGFHLGVLSILCGMITVAGGLALYTTWFCRSWLRYGFSLSLFVKYFRYSWPINVGALALLALDLGDRYVLPRTVSLAELGIYGLAYKFGMIVSTVGMVFTFYWKPRMFDFIQQKNGEHIYVRACTYFALLLTGTAVGLTVLVKPLLRIVVGKDFGPAGTYIPWIALIYALRGIGDFVRNAFYLYKKTGRDAQITWLAAILCVGGYFALIPRFRLWGAILATGIGFSTVLVVGFWQAQKVKRFRFELRRLFLVVACGVAVMGLDLYLEPDGMLGQVLVGLGFAAAYPALLAVCGFLTEDERRTLWEAVAAGKRWMGAQLARQTAAWSSGRPGEG